MREDRAGIDWIHSNFRLRLQFDIAFSDIPNPSVG